MHWAGTACSQSYDNLDLESELHGLVHVPNEIGKVRLVATNLCRGIFAILRIVDSISKVDVERVVQIIKQLAKTPGRGDFAQRSRIETLQDTAVVFAQRLTVITFSSNAKTRVGPPLKIRSNMAVGWLKTSRESNPHERVTRGVGLESVSRKKPDPEVSCFDNCKFNPRI